MMAARRARSFVRAPAPRRRGTPPEGRARLPSARLCSLAVNLDGTDLSEVARTLLRHIPSNEPPVGYLRGRGYFRDVLGHALHCSDMEAEQLVDLLEGHGYLRFEGNPSERSVADSRWLISDTPG